LEEKKKKKKIQYSPRNNEPPETDQDSVSIAKPKMLSLLWKQKVVFSLKLHQ
jgi:hypothetical protein